MENIVFEDGERVVATFGDQVREGRVETLLSLDHRFMGTGRWGELIRIAYDAPVGRTTHGFFPARLVRRAEEPKS